MLFLKQALFISALSIMAYCTATININIPVCNIDQQCGPDGSCSSNCLFQGLNASGDIVTLPIEKNATINNAGFIESDTKTSVLFEKKSKQVVILYQPSIGRLKKKQISLLFQMVNLADTAYIANLPKAMQSDITKYSIAHPTAQYVVFIFKALRKNIWTEISQTYLDISSNDKTRIPLVLQPDGNIHITLPEVPNIQKKEDFYIKIEQIS